MVHSPNQPSLALGPNLYGEGGKNEEVVFGPAAPFPDPQSLQHVFGSDYGRYYKTTGPIKAPTGQTANMGEVLSQKLQQDYYKHGDRGRWFAFAFNDTPPVPEFPPIFKTNGTTILHNSTAPHALPQGVAALHLAGINAQLATGRGRGRGIPAVNLAVRNHPLPFGAFEKEVINHILQIISAIFILIPFTFLPANFVAFLVKERQCQARHLQWVSGADSAAYWLSSLAFDLLAYLVTEALAIIVFFVFNRQEFIGSVDNFFGTFLLFLMYGVSTIPLAYLLHFLFTSPSMAQNVVMIANFIFGFLLVMAAQIMAQLKETKHANSYLVYVYRLIPSYALGEGIILLTERDLAANYAPTVPGVFDFARNGKIIAITGGIGTSLLYMGAMAPVYFLLLFVVERRRALKTALVGEVDPTPRPNFPFLHHRRQNTDAGVAAEQRHIDSGDSLRGDALSVQHLWKIYHSVSPPNVAVCDVSFGVRRGEIFAFLGTNGAGKTTTMNVLTGELQHDVGRAFVSGFNVATETRQARRMIGYCPQFDALLEHMTPTEHLYLYSRLRGVPEATIAQEARTLLELLGMTMYANTMVKALSGGNKRKLSIAIALVGGPPVMFLDEPSAGMDAVARRRLWNSLRRIALGRSVVLTTHHLEEVEALANRVAIMVKGSLRCIGPLQQVKSIYSGEQYELWIRLNNTSLLGEEQPTATTTATIPSEDENNSERKLTDAERRIMEFINEAFPGATLDTSPGNQATNRMLFRIPDVVLSAAFRKLEAFVAPSGLGADVVADYCFNQPSLEQAFLRISVEGDADAEAVD